MVNRTHLVAIMKKVILLILLLTIHTANAQEQGSISYANINKVLSIINEYAQSPHTGLIAKVKPELNGLSIEAIQLSLMHNGKLLKSINLKEDGAVEFPLLAKPIGEEAKLVINQPTGSISLEFAAGITPLVNKTVNYKELFGVLTDLETIASELVGIPTWLIPSIEKIEFTFSNKANLTITNSGKSRSYQSNSEQKIILAIDNTLYQPDTLIHFSQLPVTTTFIK